jgi:hypothetical protein
LGAGALANSCGSNGLPCLPLELPALARPKIGTAPAGSGGMACRSLPSLLPPLLPPLLRLVVVAAARSKMTLVLLLPGGAS